MKHFYTDIIVVGAGAAGLMAGAIAGEVGLKTVILERKHKPGRKLLMCGNNRCNLTSNISGNRMLEMFGEPVASFLEPAIAAFSPADLQRWFAANGLKTAVMAGSRVYPQSQKADDVLHFFTDFLRDKGITLAASAPVESVQKQGGGFLVTTNNMQLTSRYVLLATGGVSYPKTGSVGDGQTFAKQLGHEIVPYRPGLIGVELKPEVINGRVGQEEIKVTLTILDEQKQVVGETFGAWEFTKWGLEGSTISNATRIIARQNIKNYSFVLNYPDGHQEEVFPLKTRPIKEAMVTVGGVGLNEINKRTMESKKCAGLYFAGEVMDVDGPTGGYNLQAAFATARLAIADIAGKRGKTLPAIEQPVKKQSAKKQPVKRGGQNKRKHWHKRQNR